MHNMPVLLMIAVCMYVHICHRFFRSPFTQIKGHLIECNRSATEYTLRSILIHKWSQYTLKGIIALGQLDTDAHNSRTHCPSI